MFRCWNWSYRLAVGMLLVGGPVFAVNQCCSPVSGDTQCSGCQSCQVNGTSGYVNFGSNATMKCFSTSTPAACDTATRACVVLTDADVHDNAQCSHTVQLITITIQLPQCDNGDSACASGG